MYVGDPEEGAAVIEPIKDLGPAVDLIQPMPYTVFQSLLDPTAPPGMRSYWRGEYLNALSDDAIDLVLAKGPEIVRAGFPFTQTVLFRIGQAVSATPEDASAFSQRDANYLFHPLTVWSDPGDDDRLVRASRAYAEAMRAYATGAAYLNFTPEDQVRDAFGEEKYRRLVTLKDRYDPDNFFRLNQNIRPSKAEPVLA
jgi:FAD/FMN-containing dehydrogenase